MAPRRRKILCVLAAFLLLAPLPPRQAEAAVTQAEEAALIAAFLYNFTLFTAWPERSFASPQAPLRLCVYGTDRLDGALEALRGRAVQGKALRIEGVGSAEGVHGCHLLFIDGLPPGPLQAMLRSLATEATLTVGQGTGFADLGGMIALIRQDDRFGLAINVDAATRSGLALSSRLLSLAAILHH